MAAVAEPYSQHPEEEQKRQQRGNPDANVERAGTPGKSLARTRLVQRLLESRGSLAEFMNDLITTQAVVIAGTEAAGFVIEGAGPDGAPKLKAVAHIRPDNSDEATRAQAMTAFREIVGKCVVEGRDGAINVGPGTNETDPQFCLVTLLRNEGQVVAASAVIARCKDFNRAQQRLGSMQLVAGYFDLFMLKRANEQAKSVARTHQDVFQYASSVATSGNFNQAAANLCNELAGRTGASRVSIGWKKGRHVKLQAISHTEEFDKKQELSVQLVKVMEECLDQEELVQFDPAGASTENVTRDAMALSHMEGGQRVVSLPLRRESEIIGVMTLEFPQDKPASPQETTALAVAAELLSPQLYDRYQNDRYLITKAGLSTRDTAGMLVGRKHMLAKTLIAASIALLAFLIFYKPMYRVPAPFTFDVIGARQVAAPFEGELAEVFVEPGDAVTKGTLLATLDVEELELQRIAALKRAEAARREAEAMMNDQTRDMRAEALAKEAEAEAAMAEARLAEAQIAKAQIIAPVDGHVLDGDLEERIGSTVSLGDPLFLVGDQNALRVKIDVPDKDIQKVLDGTGKGTLRTKANPDVAIPFSVERIVEVSDPENGTNSYVVYAKPEKINSDWRPGGAGEVRLDWEERSLLYQWTHPLVDFVRLKLWI